MNRFIALVMRYYNSIVAVFESKPRQFEPTFYERKVGGTTAVIADEWCTGFLKGMRLDASAWRPLKRERPELLKPLELFGTRAGWRELKAGGDARMHATWSPRIAPAVREIHEFWLAHRHRGRASPAGVPIDRCGGLDSQECLQSAPTCRSPTAALGQRLSTRFTEMFSREWALDRINDRMEITEGKRVFGISVRYSCFNLPLIMHA